MAKEKPLKSETPAPAKPAVTLAETKSEIPPALKSLWKIHPYLMLGTAITLAVLAYLLIPQREAEGIKPLTAYYDGIIDALQRAKIPLKESTDSELWTMTIHAKTDCDYIFQNSPYREELETDPRLINPYLLYAESLFHYGKHPLITQNRQATFQQAVWSYTRAAQWESKDWSEHQQKVYDRQFFGAHEPYDENVLQARKKLRLQYIDYMSALAAIEADRLNLAEEKLNKILADLRWEENPTNSSANKLTTGRLPPHEFELLPEDLTNLYFYLAKLCEKRGDTLEAERYYRIFLLHARRGEEYFATLLRLGYFSFNAGKAEEKSDPEKARRLFYEASTVFSRIVADSPPGDILREAYFTGGRALFNMALTIPITETTYWDKTAKLGSAMTEILENFSGNEIPARTQYALPAVARMISAIGLSTPEPFSASSKMGGGSLLALTVKNRLTSLGERARLLRRAYTFFTGSQGGVEQKYDGPSYIMLARIYLAQSEYAKARNLLKYTLETLWTAEIADACLFTEADSFLQEGEIDRAFTRFIGGVEKLTSSLLIDDDVKSWTQLCVELSNGAASLEPIPAKQVWTFINSELQSVSEKTAISKVFPERFMSPLIKNLNFALKQENFYSPTNFAKVDLPATALRLLQQNLVLLTAENREWVNRMLLDAAFRSTILPSTDGAIIQPFPAEGKLHQSELLTAEMIREVLTEMSRRYVQMATEERQPVNLADEEPVQRLKAAAPRRYLQQASAINSYLLENYRPSNAGELLLENAYLLARGAQLAAEIPFRNIDRARELLAQSGLAFMEVSRDEHYLNLEEEALLEAGKNFYAAGRYGQASEALAEFVHNYSKSDRIGWASNLLGRCYWYLGRYSDGIRVFRDNSVRRTPDGYESLYYLGAVYLDVGNTEDELDNKVKIDRLGKTNDLYAPITLDGRLETPKTALQVFNEIRRLPGIEPSSRPWRWATFALGRTWYEIAERERNGEIAAALRGNRRATPIKWIPHFNTAEKYLRESLDRYRLAENETMVGTQKSKEPEDFEDIRRLRLESEYFLALTLREINREHPDSDTEYEIRKLFDNVISPVLYPNAMFAPYLDQYVLPQGNSLGITDGPIVRPRYLDSLRRNAFFMLAQTWRQLGKELEKKAGRVTPETQQAFEEALKIYRRARDRLPPNDSPQILYNIGDTLYDLGRTEDAGRMFLMVASQVAQMESVEKRREFTDEIRIWKTLSENRLRDLENLK